MLRPGSVVGADLALRSFAAFLVECAPDVHTVADVVRWHVEDYKPWLASRPGQNKPRVTPATMAHRLGTLRMFFVRIDEWGWDEAPVRVPMFNGDLPRQDHPLPKALDDAATAKLLRAAQADRKLLVRVTVEVLLRTGLRVSEYTSCRPTRSCRSAPHPGCTCPSASSTTTATFRCTPTSSRSSTTTGPSTCRQSIRCCYRGRTAPPWTGTRSPG